MSLEFGLLMTLIGVVSVFSSLGVVAFTCIVLKRFFRGEVRKPEVKEQTPSEKVEVKTYGETAETFKIKVNGEEHEVKVEDLGFTSKEFEKVEIPKIGEEIKLIVNGAEYKVKLEGKRIKPTAATAEKPSKIAEKVLEEAKHVVKAPMQGTVVKVLVKVGEKVEKGTPVLVLETMKMENTIESPISGVVKAVNVSEGDPVNMDDKLIVIG
ncbi:biotin/lipoyl-binding protein [Candidatus Bathyarchaeota archaeon]|nr:biotin/lipoyl-binding protein [Candidatus Bathyarchaeota archaeon]